MSILLESDFLTVNLSSILKNQRSFGDLDKVEPDSRQNTSAKRDLSQISDWGKELKDRLAANNVLEPNMRESEFDVESKFFEDYFNNGESAWDTNCAAQLLSLGQPLKKVLKVLGFDSNVNPILGFLTDDIVIRNLLQTELLNVNSFKAIYNAIAKKLVAHSEFFTANDYNVIYCQDFYRKHAGEMEQYLEQQKAILSPSAAAYSSADQERNKKVFFFIDSIKELTNEKRKADIAKLPASIALPKATDPNTKLNSLALVKMLISNTSTNKATNKKASSNNVAAVAGKLNNKAQFFAAIQNLSVTNEVPEAAQALTHESFKNLSAEQIASASTQVAPLLKSINTSDAEAKSIISAIITRLEQEY
jgi:hypothetical protein